MKKLLLPVIIILILAIQITTAQPVCEESVGQTICYEDRGETYNTSLPLIKADYHELPVTIQNAYLINTQTETKTELSTISSDGIRFSFKPKYHLGNNNYTLVLNATDTDENVVTMYVNFSIISPVMDVWVRKPENKHVQKQNFAVGNTSTFKLQLELERKGLCGYSFTPFEGDESLAKFYERITKFQQDGTTGLLNSIETFNMSQFISGYRNDGELHSLYLVCKEEGSEKYTTKEIKVGADLSPTNIELDAVPHPIIDYHQKTTNIVVETNDRSVCTLKNTNPPDNGRAIPFKNPPGTIFRALTDFIKEYEERIFLPSQNPFEYNYSVQVTCVNLANHTTTKIFEIISDQQITQDLDFIKPEKIHADKEYSLNIALIANDTCTFTHNTSDENSFRPLTFVNYTSEGKALYAGQGQGKEGENKVYVACNLITGYKTYEFTIDTTPPSAPEITANQYTCSLDEIKAEVNGTDNNGTGIKTFHYNITYMDETLEIEPKTGTTSKYIRENIIYDVDGEQLLVKAYAEDQAGNKGPETTSTMTVSNQSIPQCDFEPPEIIINKTQDNETNIWNIIIDCDDGETGSGCTASFSYSLHETEENCTYTSQATIGTPITISTSQKLCAAVYDRNENNKTHEETYTVTYPINCFNEVKDGEETDIDCGGSCIGCQLNQTCTKDSDCEQNYCATDNTCQIPSCNDGRKNGDESDIDCGGNCPILCETGNTCNSDVDCITRNCKNNVWAEPSCTNNKIDGDETDIDCGGSCKTCNDGYTCQTHSDCETGYCSQQGTCEIDPTKDSDGDGIPDKWELENFGCETCADPNADPDNDGYTNLEEYTAGTDPLSDLSKPDFYKPNPPQIITQIVAIILILGGIVMLILEYKKKKEKEKTKQQQEFTKTITSGPKPIIVKKETEPKIKISPEEEKRRREQREEAVKERKQKRRQLFNEFTKEK